MRHDFRGHTADHESEIVEGDLEDIHDCDRVLAVRRARRGRSNTDRPNQRSAGYETRSPARIGIRSRFGGGQSGHAQRRSYEQLGL